MRSIYLIVTLLILSCAFSVARASDNMKAFPPAKEGMVRYVLQLPEKSDESSFKIQLIVGKTVHIDARNKYFFGGSIEEEIIQGWGFPRYNVSQLRPMAGTHMAIDPNEPKVDRFITIGGEPFLIRYNSRLPIVVYAPEGVEVRYRIWSGAPEIKVLDEG
ncbi:MAG: ecotin family protein [Deltaproteobacteria bacterium]|jgi:ecotin|nr:ecotin family protein [Deltaproteobacteria bacterium]